MVYEIDALLSSSLSSLDIYFFEAEKKNKIRMQLNGNENERGREGKEKEGSIICMDVCKRSN